MKVDERDFLLAIYRDCRNGYRKVYDGLSPRDLIATGRLGAAKRLRGILDKWTDRGWYEYGVSLDLGWLTPEGNSLAESLSLAPQHG